MYREFKKIKLSSSYYLLLVIIFIFLNYYCFIFLYLKERMKTERNLTYFILLIFHFFFIMMIWSLARSVLSDPGQVPVFWGFFMDDPDSKKRRYCLICHIFKVFIHIYIIFLAGKMPSLLNLCSMCFGKLKYIY